MQTEADSSQYERVRAHLKFWTLFQCFTIWTVGYQQPLVTTDNFVSNGEKPGEVAGEKFNLKQLYTKFWGTESNGLVSSPFLCALALFFGAGDQVAKNLLTEIYKNLMLRSLSSKDNSCVSEFSTLTEICAEIKARSANLFFENQEKSKSEKLVQEMQISEQYNFFEDETSPEREKNLPSEGETENKLKDKKGLRRACS